MSKSLKINLILASLIVLGTVSFLNSVIAVEYGSDIMNKPTCTSFTYSDWSTCLDGTQTRTVLSRGPWPCEGGTPDLSQSCTSPHSVQATYGVYLDNATGMLSGYAWSDNIGWIKFGGLSAFPVGAGTASQNAQLNSSNKLIGWARACAGTKNGDCSTMENSADGWDGWISLAGTSVDGQYTYGVSLSGIDFSGYAWGSDVIGWIDFTGVKLSSAPIAPITITLSAASSTISKDTSTTISWSSIGADTCLISKNGSAFSTTATSGSKTSGSLSTTTTFIAQCDNSGNSKNESITVNITVPPANPPKGHGDNDCVDEGCDIIWNDECTLSEDSSFTEGTQYILDCTNPDDPENPDNPPNIVIPIAQMSNCTPLQGASSTIYVNRNTTWEIKNDFGSILKVKWSGTNIATTTTPTPTLNKIYTTIGKKNINALTIVTRTTDGTKFISACSTSTTVKLDTGTGGEI